MNLKYGIPIAFLNYYPRSRIVKTITYQEIKENEDINLYIEKGNENLGVLGFTEHSRAHAAKVAETV